MSSGGLKSNYSSSEDNTNTEKEETMKSEGEREMKTVEDGKRERSWIFFNNFKILLFKHNTVCRNIYKKCIYANYGLYNCIIKA